MRFPGSKRLVALLAIMVVAPLVWAQETTGGLQGTVKDSSGAVVAGAHIIVAGTTLVGKKEIDTDTSGYYRFAKLPPGLYSITVTAKNFKSGKREGLEDPVGHLPPAHITREDGK